VDNLSCSENCGHRARSGFGHFWVNFALVVWTGIGVLINTLTLFFITIAYCRLKVLFQDGERVILVRFSSFGFVSVWGSVKGNGVRK
jgi:hypothetical protein